MRSILPLSYESRYQHMITAIGVGPNVNREFEFGQVNDEERKWTLRLTYTFVAYKYFQTSDFRGSGPNDTTGCLAPPSGGAPGASGGPGAVGVGRPIVAAVRPTRTSRSSNGIIASLSRGKWSVGMTLLVQNIFNHSIPPDMFTSTNGAARAQSDTTWGIVSPATSCAPTSGCPPASPACSPRSIARYRYPRFPFFDFSGGANCNNYTQAVLGRQRNALGRNRHVRRQPS